MADIQNAMGNSVRQRGKKASFETPVGKEKRGFPFRPLEREHVPEEIRSKKKGFHLAESTSEETIRFLKNRGCPALGALVFDDDSGKLRCHFPLSSPLKSKKEVSHSHGKRCRVQGAGKGSSGCPRTLNLAP